LVRPLEAASRNISEIHHYSLDIFDDILRHSCLLVINIPLKSYSVEYAVSRRISHSVFRGAHANGAKTTKCVAETANKWLSTKKLKGMQHLYSATSGNCSEICDGRIVLFWLKQNDFKTVSKLFCFSFISLYGGKF